MAKRKRLIPTPSGSAPLETKAHGAPQASQGPLGLPMATSTPQSAPESAEPPRRPPIAQVAGDAATQAALNELAADLKSARADGRLVQVLPLEEITANHLLRDRMGSDPDEMEALKASLNARGQQTPIEVIELAEGGFGLISGWRRLKALQELLTETGEERFATIRALIKPLESVPDSYVAMVEENEIRANLSFYERARLACEAARLEIFPTPTRAVQVLFANATSARRSKINSFVRVHRTFGDLLRFPVAIPERLGLAMASALETDSEFSQRLRDALRKTQAKDAKAERATLERALRKTGAGQGSEPPAEIIPGVYVEAKAGRVVLSGKGVTPELAQELQNWLSQR